MKFQVFFIGVLLSSFVFGRNIEKFDRAMMDSIQKVIKENPEKYETRNPGRFPASVEPVSEEHVQKDEEKLKKMDVLNNGAIGLPKW